MPKQVWIFASVFTALILLGFAGFTAWQRGQEIKGLRAQMEQNEARLGSMTNQLALAKTQIDDLQQQKDAAAQAQKNLAQEMRNAIESKDVTISQLQGKLTVNILDRILFDSGEAVLKPEGEEVLKQIATVLSQYPQRQIHVIGHTDNVPIRASARNKYASNWELSTGRATAAVRFLCENAGVDPRRLGAVGYGEFHPIADNSTAEGRAKNRRIALVVLSEELAGSDVAELSRVVPPKPGTTNTPTANLTAGTNKPAGDAAPTNAACAKPSPTAGADNPAFANPPTISTNRLDAATNAEGRGSSPR
jgi:flagellar motor protein MotB